MVETTDTPTVESDLTQATGDVSDALLREASRTLFGEVDGRVEDLRCFENDEGVLFATAPQVESFVSIDASEGLEATVLEPEEVNQSELTPLTRALGGD